MSNIKSAVLRLADGTQFKGFSFGAECTVFGEVVFNTSMLGWPELLTDPATHGQILTLTYPLIGNYGIPPFEKEDGLLLDFESDEVQIVGLVVSDYSEEYSHWNAAESLADWLKRSGVPAICGVDTRELARHIRENGEMSGKIVIEGAPEKKAEAAVHYTEGEFGKGDVTIAIVGDNIKNNIIRSLTRRGAKVTTDTSAHYDGMMVTGSAGDPKATVKAIEETGKAIAAGIPVFGVCGGDTLLALAAGGEVVKLKHGHRSCNQPVFEAGTSHANITTQHHGWAVDGAKLPKGWEIWYTNLNDNTVEGIRHSSLPFGAVAFHPEATNRPVEADPLYDNFIASVRKHKK